MSNTSLSIQLSDSEGSSSSGVILRLEQEERPIDAMTINDIYQMWLLAKAGISARTYKPYSSDVAFNGDYVTFSIGFYVWPIPANLPYGLSFNLREITPEQQEAEEEEITDGSEFGFITEAEVLEKESQQTVVFPLNNRVEIDAVVQDLDYHWVTPVYNRLGALQPPPDITLVNNALIIPDDYFGAARVNLIQQGFRHEVQITLANINEDGQNIKIDDINITITATWQNLEGETETAELQLELPAALAAALRLCGNNHDRVCHDCDNYLVHVYYSICDGGVIDTKVIDLDGSGSWCLPA